MICLLMRFGTTEPCKLRRRPVVEYKYNWPRIMRKDCGDGANLNRNALSFTTAQYARLLDIMQGELFEYGVFDAYFCV